jgi:hypothetical protein
MSEKSYVQARRLRVDGVTLERVFDRQEWDALPNHKNGFRAVFEFEADPSQVDVGDREEFELRSVVPQRTQEETDWDLARVALYAFDTARADLLAILRATPDRSQKLTDIQIWTNKVTSAKARVESYLRRKRAEKRYTDQLPAGFRTDERRGLPPGTDWQLALLDAKDALTRLLDWLQLQKANVEAAIVRPQEPEPPLELAGLVPTCPPEALPGVLRFIWENYRGRQKAAEIALLMIAIEDLKMLPSVHDNKTEAAQIAVEVLGAKLTPQSLGQNLNKLTGPGGIDAKTNRQIQLIKARIIEAAEKK